MLVDQVCMYGMHVLQLATVLYYKMRTYDFNETMLENTVTVSKLEHVLCIWHRVLYFKYSTVLLIASGVKRRSFC